ncbi:MAG TPA: hypothetical protein VKN74_08290 [Candidatus Mcinerneyibacterium sp.]|nr:hypothetical protein [Candidatus Mcinerneyibacterium sp.]
MGINNNNQKYQISPQWITVKEEFVCSFFDLANSFSSWQVSPSNSDLRKSWMKDLKSLYLKIRIKMQRYNDKYKEISEEIDKYIFGMKSFNIASQIEHTKHILAFIEEIGLTKVEQEAQSWEERSF